MNYVGITCILLGKENWILTKQTTQSTEMRFLRWVQVTEK
jgi:hypothetical protein